MATVRSGREPKGAEWHRRGCEQTSAEWQRRGLEYWGVAKKRTCTDETGKAAESLSREVRWHRVTLSRYATDQQCHERLGKGEA